MKALGALFNVVTVVAVAPVVPEVTEIHKQSLQAVREVAAPAAAQARPMLMSLLDGDEFRGYLKKIDPAIADLPSSEIYQRLEGELQVAEVTHNFEPYLQGGMLPNKTYDLNVNTTIGYDYLLNLWQLKLLKLNNYPSWYEEVFSDAETNVYHLPKMPLHPTYEEASSRLIYGALQWMKPTTASAVLYGGVGLVFDNNHIRNYTAIAPSDTGSWEGTCGRFKPLTPKSERIPFDCAYYGGHPVPGTFDHWEHLILGNVMYWNITLNYSNPTNPYIYASPSENLATLVARSLNTHYPDATLVTSLSTIRYSEACPFMNLDYKRGVKTLIYNFTDGFGTGMGRVFQDWAITNNWVMVWADVPNELAPARRNERFIDPYVLMNTTAGSNFTSDARFAPLLSKFMTLWESVNETMPTIPPSEYNEWYISQWNTTWSSFENTLLQAQPLSAGACASSSCSVTRVIDGVCVCR